MPKYNYHCEECEEYFEARHHEGEFDNCILCYPSPRVPSIPNYITKINKKNDQKAGSLVEKYEENKQSVKKKRKIKKSGI